MSRKSAKSDESAKSGASAKPANLVVLLKTPRARALALAVGCVTAAIAAAFLVIALGEPSRPDTAAFDEQPPPATVTQNTARPRATREATSTTRAANRPRASESESKATPVTEITREASTMAAVQAAPITVTGCLERDDDTFRLKDTEGENVPTSRSWKGGFLRRSNRSVEVVDTSNRFKLANHVGERVRATGTLVDGDMQLRSLRRVGTSCEEEV